MTNLDKCILEAIEKTALRPAAIAKFVGVDVARVSLRLRVLRYAGHAVRFKGALWRAAPPGQPPPDAPLRRPRASKHLATIIEMRARGETLMACGVACGLTRERVRQILKLDAPEWSGDLRPKCGTCQHTLTTRGTCNVCRPKPARAIRSSIRAALLEALTDGAWHLVIDLQNDGVPGANRGSYYQGQGPLSALVREGVVRAARAFNGPHASLAVQIATSDVPLPEKTPYVRQQASPRPKPWYVYCAQGPTADAVLKVLRGRTYTVHEVARAVQRGENPTNNTLAALVKMGLARRIKRGVYAAKEGT